MSWTVYCHTHIESGRRYVGLTSQTVKKRWNQHVTKSKSSKGGRWHFPNAIRKYGKNAFSHEVLAICDSLEEANEIEREKIEEFQTRDPRFGFNLAHGGEHKPHLIKNNPWNDPAYGQRVSMSLKKTLSDPAHKLKQSVASIEVHSRREVKKKLSDASLAMWQRGEYRGKQTSWSSSEEFHRKCLAGFVLGASLLRSRTHCVNGHEFTDDNTRMERGRRICKACHRDVCRSSREELKKSPEKLAEKRSYNRERMRESRARRLNSS